LRKNQGGREGRILLEKHQKMGGKRKREEGTLSERRFHLLQAVSGKGKRALKGGKT